MNTAWLSRRRRGDGFRLDEKPVDVSYERISDQAPLRLPTPEARAVTEGMRKLLQLLL